MIDRACNWLMTLVLWAGVIAVAAAFYGSRAEPMMDAGAGVSSRTCWLMVNPWLAANWIERYVDGCSWNANGWATPDPAAPLTAAG